MADQDQSVTIPGLKELGQAYSNTADTISQAYQQAKSTAAPYIASATQSVKDIVSSTAQPLKQAATNTMDYYGGKLGVGASKTGAMVGQAAGQAATKVKAGYGAVELAQPEKRVITDKQRSEEQNRELKNPYQASGWEARSQAMGGKLQRLYEDPRYQAMSPADKVATRSKFYDMYYVPMAKEAGVHIIDKDKWLMDSRYDIQGSTALGLAQDLTAATERRAIKILGGAISINRTSWAAMFGLNNYFHGDTAHNLDASWRKGEGQANSFLWGRAARSLQAGLEDTNFFINSRPRDSLLSSLSVLTGDQLLMLPIYRATGAALAPVGAALGAGEAVPTAGKLWDTVTGETVLPKNLTQTLMKSPIGVGVSKRLIEAADGYISSRIAGDTHEESVQSAKAFATFGAAMVPLKAGWKTAAKIFFSKTAAEGGIPFVQEVVDSVVAEAAGKDVGAEARKAEDPVSHNVHEAVSGIMNDISQDLHGEPLKEAVKDPVKKDEIIAETAKVATHGAAEAPVHMKEQVLEQNKNDIAEHNKANPISNKWTEHLKQEGGIDVAASQTESDVQAAAHQSGLINPEGAAKNIAAVKNPAERKAAKEAAKDAEAAAKAQEIIKERKAVLKEAATKSTKQQRKEDWEAFKKEERQIKEDIRKEERELAEKRRAAKAKPVDTEYEPQEGEGAAVTMQEFTGAISDTKAYYKNPKRRASIEKALDKKFGDRKSWTQRIKDSDPKRFMELLKEVDGDKIPFENNEHRMLWHWHFKEHMDAALKNNLKDHLELKLRKETQVKDFNAYLDRKSNRLMGHLTNLVKGGNLRRGEPVFNSTRTVGTKTTWTKEQEEIVREMEAQAKVDPKMKRELERNVKNSKSGLQTLDLTDRLIESRKRGR